MTDLSNLLTELSSPEDRLEYEQYASGIDLFVKNAKEQKLKLADDIKKLKKSTFKKRVTEFFNVKIRKRNKEELSELSSQQIVWNQAITNPEDFILNTYTSSKKIIEITDKPKTFTELSVGAKKYAALKLIIDEATQTGETDSNKVVETFKTFQQSIEKCPLRYSSPRQCLYFCDDWNKCIERAKKIREEREEKQAFSEIKHVSLTKFFKGHFIDKHTEVVDILTKCQVQREAGCLPPEWIAILQKEQIAAKTKEISQILQDFSNNTNSSRSIPQHMLEPEIQKLSQRLSQTLNTKVEASFLGNGAIGKAIKLVTNNDKALVLKTNHSNPKFRTNQGHGVQIEGARGIFASSNNDRNKYSTTYFVRVGDDRATDCFMISRFVEKKDNEHTIAKTESIDILENSILDCKDAAQKEVIQIQNFDIHEGNIVEDVCIDLGGLYIPQYMRDPKCYKLFKTLYKSLSRKDGPQLIEKIVNTCEKKPELRKKFEMVKKGIQTVLRRHPDVDATGTICDYGFRPECMEKLGVTNKLDIFEAFRRAHITKTTHCFSYIIESRGADKIAKTLEEQGGKDPQNYIDMDAACFLLDSNIPSSSIKGALQEYCLKGFEQYEQKLVAKRLNRQRGIIGVNDRATTESTRKREIDPQIFNRRMDMPAR